MTMTIQQKLIATLKSILGNKKESIKERDIKRDTDKALKGKF